HPLAECHRAHVDVPLDKAHGVPFLHQLAAFHLAELVGGDATDGGQIGEHADGALYATGQHHGVAIDHTDHRVLQRHLPGEGTEGMGQAITLTGAAGTHDDQLDVVPIAHFLAHDVLDEVLVAFLHDRGDDGAGHRHSLHFLKYRLIHLEGGMSRDTEAGDHHEHMVGQRCGSHALDGLAHPREAPVQEVHPAEVVSGRIAVTPHTQGADQENELLVRRVEIARVHHFRAKRDQGDQA